MNFNAVIFDMDGLLLDTEIISMQTFQEACEVFNINVDNSVYFQCIGTNAAKTKEIMMQGFGNGFPYDDILQIWSEKYHQQAIEQPVPLKTGAKWLLDEITKKKLPMAVATSTDHEKAIKKLRNAEIIDYFRVIVSGDQVQKSKPHPDIYLKAASTLAIPPEKCLALEDSEVGVRAAHTAGMTVLQIPDLIEPSDEIKSLEHTIINSLFDVAPYLVSY